jgi:hypothetical protein
MRTHADGGSRVRVMPSTSTVRERRKGLGRRGGLRPETVLRRVAPSCPTLTALWTNCFQSRLQPREPTRQAGHERMLAASDFAKASGVRTVSPIGAATPVQDAHLDLSLVCATPPPRMPIERCAATRALVCGANVFSGVLSTGASEIFRAGTGRSPWPTISSVLCVGENARRIIISHCGREEPSTFLARTPCAAASGRERTSAPPAEGGTTNAGTPPQPARSAKLADGATALLSHVHVEALSVGSVECARQGAHSSAAASRSMARPQLGFTRQPRRQAHALSPGLRVRLNSSAFGLLCAGGAKNSCIFHGPVHTAAVRSNKKLRPLLQSESRSSRAS